MMMGEDRNKVSIDEDDPNDQFPVGMRVLAVDDDPTCLRLLESMLQRCQYNVTTTTHAMKALNILKDNKTKIDLIISDVDMPEMDGFKLLELVGLEMDLPVIMLSAYGETKFVMKGIKHGACDYLLKPVRIEELKNIWQHVLRKKKPNSKHANSDENLENPPKRTLEEGQSSAVAILHIDQNGESNKKRKDQDEDDEDDDESEENDNDSEDQSTHKKPRVVWTPELHQLFLSAVNQLGVDKAVPKKILSLMNVERLSRENVASHLQKYRLYMKKLNTGDSHQANMMATLRGRTSSYSRMGTALDRFNDFQAFTRSTSLSNVGFGSYPPGAMLGRLNTPSLGLHGFSSGMGQLGYASNSSQSTMFLGNRYGSFERTSTSLKIEQLQQNKYPSRMGELAPAIDDPSLFSLLTDYLNPSTNIGSSSNQGNMEIPSSVSIPPPNQGTFDTSLGVPAQINWQGVDPLTGFPSNLLPMGDPFDQVGPSSYLDDFSSFSTSMPPSTSLQNTITGTQNQVIIDDFHVAENNLPDFGMNNMVDQLMNSSSPINDVSHSFSQSLVQDNAINGNPSLIDQSNGGPSSMLLSEEFENHLDQGVSNNNGFVANSSSASKNALRDAMIKHFN